MVGVLLFNKANEKSKVITEEIYHCNNLLHVPSTYTLPTQTSILSLIMKESQVKSESLDECWLQA